MTPAILLLDYEPRTAVRVTEALASLGCQLVTARDVDGAVAACAKIEPQVVLTTSVLPRVKVEDAITQLRARAGLRHTPVLVLMSGYTGHDPRADAERLGAQDIIAKPFSNNDLLERVRALLSRPRAESRAGADTRAEVLEALRRASGSDETGTVTSKDLFGDLLAEEQGASRASTKSVEGRPATAASPNPPTPDAAKLPPAPRDADTTVDQALASTLADLGRTPAKPQKARKETAEVSVDKLLEDTLSGLDLHKSRPAAKPAPAAKSAPAAPVPPTPRPAPQWRTPGAEEPPEPFAGPPDLPPISQEPFGQPVELPREPAPAPDLEAPETEAVHAPLPSGTPFGQYELMEPIATGGMAEVYRARMRGVEGFQKIVAIKRILPHLTDNDEFLSMFVDEAKLAAQLQHPNIIHIYDLGKIDRSYYIAMEFIDGRDLRSILQTLEDKQERLPLGLALFIASRLAAALDYAHRKHDLQGRAMGLVHRDVSPQNVLISYDGDIKLCDFGIVKAASKASHTRSGALKGKLQYMSPEQAWGKDIDKRSDIYSLGLVFYEMLTGRKPFTGDSELSILEQVRSPHLIPPRELDPAIPPEVERVAMKALREDREDRYQTAEELAGDLGNMLQVIRPAPGASELGGFLGELVGRERAASTRTVPTPRPAVTPPPRPAPTPPAKEPVRVRHVAPPEHARAEIPEVLTEPRKSRVALFVGVGVVVVAVAAGALYLTRAKRPVSGAAAEATPAPETVEMAREAAQQEVARQSEALRERLTNEGQSPAAVPSPRRPAAAPPVRAAAVVATPPGRSPAAIVPPAPTQAPTAAATPATAAVEPAAITPAEEPTTTVPTVPTIAPTSVPPAPTQPAVREGDLVEAGNDVVLPEAIFSPKPTYPPAAERQRVTGVVLLGVLVDEKGAVQDVRLLRGIRPDLGLTAAAIDAVRTWRYKPATKEGVRVKMRITVAVTFQLQP